MNRPLTIVFANNTCRYIYLMRMGLVRSFIKDGHSVVVFAPIDRWSDKLSSIGVEVVDTSFSYNPLTLEFYKFFFNAFILARRLKPDFVMGYTFLPNLAFGLCAYICNYNFVPNISGLGSGFISGGFKRWILITAYRVLLAKAYKIFFQNNDDFKLFREMAIVACERCQVLPGSGVDLSRFPYLPYPPEQGYLVVLFIGRLIKDKGIFEFLQAAEFFQAVSPDQFRFWVVGASGGDNPGALSLEEIQAYADKGVVKYFGEVDDVTAYLDRSHIACLPSYREGTSRFLLEAAAVGRPLLTTAVPGCKYLVTEGVNGYLVNAQDVDSLISGLRRFSEHSNKELENFGMQSRLLVEARFSETIVIESYRRIIFKATQGGF